MTFDIKLCIYNIIFGAHGCQSFDGTDSGQHAVDWLVGGAQLAAAVGRRQLLAHQERAVARPRGHRRVHLLLSI